MRAAVLTGPEPLTVQDVDLDGPEAGEVLVRVEACGVCHSDLHVINRARDVGVTVPMVLGHEVAGVVEGVGSGVTHVAEGDHVVVAFRPNCGSCFYCDRHQPQLCERGDIADRMAVGDRPRLRWQGKPVQQGIGVGGFAERVVVPQRAAIKVREDAPLDVVCLVGCGVTTGFGAAVNTARVRPGESVAVIGVGGVGLNIIQGARVAGASRVIAVDMVQDKLKLAQSFGATDVVNAGEGDPVEQVRELTGGQLDYAFEAIGLPATVQQSLAMVRRGGTAVVVGLTRDPVTVPGLDFLAEKRLIGSFYGSATVQHDIPKIIDLYMDGRIMLDELVSMRRPLEELNEAFTDMERGAVARSVITFG